MLIPCGDQDVRQYIGTVFITDTSTSMTTVHIFVKPAIAMEKK
jgi:hypothetical protein